MKTLRIIVLKGSALDSWLADAGYTYDKIIHISEIVCYKMHNSKPLDLIDLLVSKFCITEFSVDCLDGHVFFRVRS